MKKLLRLKGMLFLAVMLLVGANTWAQAVTVEEYDFLTFVSHGVDISTTLQLSDQSIEQQGSNAKTVYVASNPVATDETVLELNGRIALDSNGKTGNQRRWILRSGSSNAYQNGLVGNWNGNGAEVASYNISVLNLHQGDKIAITFAIRTGKDATPYTCSANVISTADDTALEADKALVSGTQYTMLVDGNLDLYVKDDNLAIQKIVIESVAAEEPVPAETVGTYTMTVLPTSILGEKTAATADIEVTVKKAGENYWLESEADVFKGLAIPFTYNDVTKFATFEQTFVTTTEDAAFADSPNLYAAAFVFNGSFTELQPTYAATFDAETGFTFGEDAGLAWFACDNDATPYDVYSAFYVVVPGAEDEEPSLAPGDYSVTYALKDGETHTAGETVVVSAEDITVATLTFGFEGGADFTAPKKDDKRIEGFWGYTEGNGQNGKSTEGTVYIINPKYDGQIEAGVVLNGGKPFFVEEDGVSLADYDGITTTDKYYGTYTFNVKAGSEYKVYCTGSKLGFYGFNYKFTVGGSEEEVIFGNASIEGEWKFAISDHYAGVDSRGEVTDTYTATLEGNTVTFMDEWEEAPIIAEFTAENTLTFKTIAVSELGMYPMTQKPFTDGSKVTDLSTNPEEFVFESFTATYDPEAGTLTFPEGAGLLYGNADAAGEFKAFTLAFDLVSAAQAKAEEVIYGDASIEGEWKVAINDHYVGASSRGEVTDTYTATLDGNTVTFADPWDEAPMVAEFTAENTLTFKQAAVGVPAVKTLTQIPFVAGPEGTVEEINPEDFTFASFTATYDAETGTITFPAGAGLAYGYVDASGMTSYYHSAFEFVSAKKAGAEEPQPEVTRRWDFTNWSEATVANLIADAAQGVTEGWSDVEKNGDTEPTETSKDNCFWSINTPDEIGGLSANNVLIDELKGLKFGANVNNRGLAIAVNYPVALSTYEGPAYLWLGGSNKQFFTIPAVKAGSTIKMGIESHKTTDARGVDLLVNGTSIGQFTPTTYAENTWTVTADEAVDVVVDNTNGCHIYYIEVVQDQEALLAAAKADLATVIAAVEAIEDFSAYTEESVAALAAALTAASNVEETATVAEITEATYALLNARGALTEAPEITEPEVTLVHTASSFSEGTAGEFQSTVDAEYEHVNNTNAAAAWAGYAYAEFAVAIPEGKPYTATLTFTGRGESRNPRNCDVLYVNAGETLDYEALAAGNAQVDLAATAITSVTFPKGADATEEFTVDVTAALKAIVAEGQKYVIFKFTGNPGGGDLLGKASEKAPQLTVVMLDEEPEVPEVDPLEVTADLFYTWDGYGADAKAIDPIEVESHYGEAIGAGAMVLGTSTVDYLIYADLTGRSGLLIEGTPGTELRILMNRQESNNGPLVEKNVTIDETGTAEVDLTDLEYVHLNSIKTTWGMAGTGSVTKINAYINMPVRFTYKVNEVVNGEVVRTTTGKAEEGSTIKVPYRKYNVLDGKLYTKGVTNKEYNYSFTLTTDGQEENLEYTATETENVVFFSEGEDIETLTLCEGTDAVNSTIRSSNSAAAYAAEDAAIVTLGAGTYVLNAIIFDASKTPDSYWVFKAGETEIANLHCTTVNIQELKSEEFTLTEETTIIMAQAGSNKMGLDAIYIVKTGDVATGINTVNAEFENGAVYNLQGQKVVKAQKGLYIINGKKVVVK